MMPPQSVPRAYGGKSGRITCMRDSDDSPCGHRQSTTVCLISEHRRAPKEAWLCNTFCVLDSAAAVGICCESGMQQGSTAKRAFLDEASRDPVQVLVRRSP